MKFKSTPEQKRLLIKMRGSKVQAESKLSLQRRDCFNLWNLHNASVEEDNTLLLTLRHPVDRSIRRFVLVILYAVRSIQTGQVPSHQQQRAAA
jgi:hypothetical protein